MSPLAAVLACIDAANARDPNLEPTPEGPVPAALLYGLRMTDVLNAFAPGSAEELIIAARGQHIERWMRPRTDYADGREGYLSWRRDAARCHAGRVGDIMQSCGYGEAACDRVAALMRKKHLKTDAEAQTLEDVACLVFLRWYAGAFSGKHTTDRVLSIVSKTAQKMSARGRSAALALELPAPVAAMIAKLDSTSSGNA